MSEATSISWTDRTFSPWWGCARVSPACRSCYADALSSRWGHELWRRHGPRRVVAEATWRNPVRWNREAQRAGRSLKTFCASMCDVFEAHPVPEVNAELDQARARLWDLIEATPHLRWQLLTKRPENVRGMVPWKPGSWPDHVWLGTSVETQRWADTRIPLLLDAGATVTFLSAEPLLGEIHLDKAVDWVIGGGESGRRPRTTELAWFRSLRDQCRAAGVAFWMKQTGTAAARELEHRGKGESLDVIPADLHVREFPADPCEAVSAS